MTERIYTRDQQGRLEPLEEERFAREDELQALIAEHPEVLDGEQMRPGDPLRWILITREPLAKLPGDWGWAQSSALLVNTIALDRRLDILSGEPAARQR